MAPDAFVREVLSRSAETALRLYAPEPYDEEGGTGVGGWDTLARKWNKPALGIDGVPGVQREVFQAVHIWRDRVAREEDESTGYAYPRSHICDRIDMRDGYILSNRFVFKLVEQPPADMAALLHTFPSAPPVILEHRVRAQRVIHPGPHIVSPRRALLSPAPLHALHQRTRIVALATRLRTLRAHFLRQRRMPFGTAHPARHRHRDDHNQRSCPHRVLVAFFRKDHAVPFRSDIPGRPETQVGRWHAMRKKGENDEESQGGEVGLTAEESLKDVDWETIWDRSLKGSEVPPALRGLRCVRFPLTLARPVVKPYMVLVLFNPENKTCILSSLSRTTPPRVSTSHFPPSHWRPRSVLSRAFPHPMEKSFNFSSKLGLFYSSTPFVTGRPYTLIHNGSAHSTGAVGIALSAGPRPALQMAYPGLRAISPSLTVTA